MPELQRFGRYEISQDFSGKPIELYQARGEKICLAFDTGRRCLIELHLLSESTKLTPDEKQSFFERLKLARGLRGDSGFSSVLRGDNASGTLFYTANINDGEPVTEYVRRLGPIPVETALGLAVDLSEKLKSLSKFQRILNAVSLTNAMLMVGEGGSLRIRVVDFGLARPELEANGEAILVREFAWLLLNMMTGQERPVDGEGGPKIKLGGLPITLRQLLKGLLTSAVTAPVDLYALDEALQEALKSVQRSFLARTQRRHLVVSSRFHPKTTLERHLIPTPTLPKELSDRFRDDERAFGPKDPFRLHLVEGATSDRLAMQILPPFRILSKENYTPVPESLDRANMAKFPHLMDVFEGWESDQAIYLAEENWPGFPLPYLLRIKGRLKPIETLVLLRQVVHGLRQATESRIKIHQIRPRDFQVCFPHRTTQADMRHLLERRIDMWPKFVIKLRTHSSIRALIQPESEIESAIVDLKQQQPELLKQRFVALAIEFLTGQTGTLPRSNLPAGIYQLFERCSRDIREGNPVMEPAAFVEEFEAQLDSAPQEPPFRNYLWAGAPNGKAVLEPASKPVRPKREDLDIPETVAIGIKRRAFYKGPFVEDEESGQLIPAPGSLDPVPAILWDKGELEARYEQPLGVGEAILAAVAAKEAQAANPDRAEAWPDENLDLPDPSFALEIDAPEPNKIVSIDLALASEKDESEERFNLIARLKEPAILVAQVAAILFIPLFLFLGFPGSQRNEPVPIPEQAEQPPVEESEGAANSLHPPLELLPVSGKGMPRMGMPRKGPQRLSPPKS